MTKEEYASEIERLKAELAFQLKREELATALLDSKNRKVEELEQQLTSARAAFFSMRGVTQVFLPHLPHKVQLAMAEVENTLSQREDSSNAS